MRYDPGFVTPGLLSPAAALLFGFYSCREAAIPLVSWFTAHKNSVPSDIVGSSVIHIHSNRTSTEDSSSLFHLEVVRFRVGAAPITEMTARRDCVMRSFKPSDQLGDGHSIGCTACHDERYLTFLLAELGRSERCVIAEGDIAVANGTRF